MKRTRIAAVTLLAGLALIGGCNSQQAADDAAMALKAQNSYCPVCGSPVNPEVPTVAHKGKNIGFCCTGCPAKFTNMTPAQRDAALAAHSGM